MAIQNRRGVYANFDPTKMLPGEFAIVQSGDTTSTDGTSVYICTTAGNVKRLAATDDIVDYNAGIQEALDDALEDIDDARDDAVDVIENYISVSGTTLIIGGSS